MIDRQEDTAAIRDEAGPSVDPTPPGPAARVQEPSEELRRAGVSPQGGSLPTEADEVFSFPPRKSLPIFGRRMPLPATRGWRIALGIALVIGGVFSFLPILGLWMLPLGFLVLSIDLVFVRRWRRRANLKWGRWRKQRRPKPDAPVAD